MAVISAIWWVLGWYPITSVLMGVTVVGLAGGVVPAGWVQPAVNSKRAIAMSANAIIFMEFMGGVLPCR
jgi:hypothetical protein